MVDDNNPIRRRNFLMGAGTAVAAASLTPYAVEAQMRMSFDLPRRRQPCALLHSQTGGGVSV